MQQSQLLSDFFNSIAGDPRISITHIGIYAALLQYWQTHNCAIPMYVFSHEIMQLAKVTASTTYHKCIRDLNNYGYVRYEASFKRNRGSKIFMI